MKAALRLLLVTTTLVLAGPAFAEVLSIAKPETVDVSPDRLSRIRTVLQKEVDADRMPGAVVMIARRGQLIYSEAIGFQDKAAGKPMSKEAIFRIYSMTKPLASVAAMMLVEEGKMQLTDPVAKFLPQLAKMEVLVTDKDGKTTRETAKRQITIQDLFRHTAGFAYGEFSNIPELKAAYAEAKLFQPTVTAESRMITPEQFVTGIAKAPLVHEPGTTWEYSMSVDVLGRVVEAISGQRLSAFLDERLFRPLNMVDTGFKVPEPQWSRIAEPLAEKSAHRRPQRRHARREDRSLERLWWWRCGIDCRRLPSLLPNDVERWHARWPQVSEPNERQADGFRSFGQSPSITGNTRRPTDGC